MWLDPDGEKREYKYSTGILCKFLFILYLIHEIHVIKYFFV